MDEQISIRDVLEKHRGERHVIVLHHTPDPDAISSAYAHQMISQAYGIESAVLYSGKVSEQRIIALLKLLGIDLLKFDENSDLSQFDGAVFVDTQGISSEAVIDGLEDAGVPQLIVVDHHDPTGKLQPEFRDICRTGATATIYSGYLEQGVIEMDKSRKEHVAMATALLYGILTDTVDFVTAQPADFEAAAFLSRFRDAEFLEHIMSQARTRQVMEIIRRALGDREIVESYSIAGIGYLRAEDREAIPQAAKFLLTEENVHTAIVYGIMKENDQDETLVGALHTLKITLSPEEFLQEVFQENLVSTYNSKDNISAGTFAIPVGFLAGDSTERWQELKWQVFDAQMKQKIFNRIGVAREVLLEEISI